ncbi:16S rRNA (cytosine(1402)-N(4))-methyltransferase RsmH [Reinekea blandensis]|uniref:Ribosomal RNA small subunit methyltransferase H n=1 Tax=Reinekea blandensis MED297 TaxID=314283 RepID=A4BFS1_9GAMM|nr:16S rRNA (cytosine(1402)-N(4))-methyltransferase RsmH [Reinekea blandensis]EAR08939.1 S-adenosyl-methyltransferase [Reinekea sp. MED297] [Reinekea blandensis MED297]
MSLPSDQPYSHETVLLHETVEAVDVGSGVYVDGTFGRGGHSRLLLSRLDADARLIVFDKDPLAIATANELAAEDSRVTVVQRGFAELSSVLKQAGLMGQVSGILLDLGVSSPQLDDAERGFSFRADGPLDMRMNPESGESAAQWIARVSEKELADVLFQYGDERFSRRIARAIVTARQKQPIERTLQLAEIIKTAHPKWDHKKHPATKSFQAIRIAVNGELDELDAVLSASVGALKPGGRLAVISFHSLEDRAVKQFIKLQAKGPELPPGLPVRDEDIHVTMKAVGKAIKASAEEVAVNVRSRSAVLRVAEKLSR